MYIGTYEFCGVPVETAAPCAMQEDAQAALFRTERRREPLLRISLEPVETLEIPPETAASAGEKRIWRRGQTVIRQTRDRFRPVPHMTVAYDLDDLTAVRAFVRREDWVWATKTKYLWTGAALNQLLLHFGVLFFHASYVAYRGQGILFTAPSGTGKSTQAELWRRCRGAEIINGDKAGVSLRGTPGIHSIPFSGTSGICRNVSLPLAAVVVLSQAPENTVRRMGPTETLSAICGNVFADQAVPEEWALTLGLMLDLAAAVPVYALACTPDERAVEALEQAMIQEGTIHGQRI